MYFLLINARYFNIEQILVVAGVKVGAEMLMMAGTLMDLLLYNMKKLR